MKSIRWALVLVALTCGDCFAGTLMKGDVVKLDRSGTFGGASGGGEFALWKLDSGSWIKQGITFCLEFNEYLSLGESMIIGGISDRSVFGGVGGQVSVLGVNTGDPMDAKSQHIFRNYLNGSLAAALPPGTNQNNLANATQEAIWNLENEISSVSALATSIINTASGASGPISGVVALNLFAGNTPEFLIKQFDPLNSATWTTVFEGKTLANYKKQDQMFYQPPPVGQNDIPTVPEPGMMTIFGLGAFAYSFASFRTRRSRTASAS